MPIRPLVTLVSVSVLLVVLFTAHPSAIPAAPTPLAPANGASVVVPFTIAWSAVTDPSGILGYNWEVSTTSTFSSVILRDSTNADITSDVVSGLQNGTYFWRVRAASGAFEQGAWSAVRSFTVTGTATGTPAAPALDPPVGYSTFHPWETISFTWSAVPEAATYVLQLSNDANFPVGTTPAGVITTWFDNIASNRYSFTHALPEGVWYVRVWGVAADGTAGRASNVISYTVFYSNPVPPPPALLSPLGNPTVNLPITLRWAHVVNPQPSGYEVQISSSSSFSTNEAPLGVQLTNPEFHVFTLTAGTKFWRVRSHQGMSSPTTTATTAWSAAGSFTVSTAPPVPVSITPVRSPLFSGDDTWVTVQLSAGVPATGATVALSSSNPAVAPAPSSIAIPGTDAWAQFQMRVGQVTTATPVTLTATLNGKSASGQFTVNPPSLKSLMFTSPNVSAGSPAVAILSLNGRAPGSGAVVTLSSNSSAVTPPQTVTIAAGASQVALSLPTRDVSASTSATITATWNGVSVQSQVVVWPAPTPTSLTLTPSTVVGGGPGSVDGLIIVSAAAPFDQTVRVTSSNPAVTPFLASGAVIPAGTTRGSIQVLPAAVSSTTIVTISVTGNGVTRSAALTVTPATTSTPPDTSTPSGTAMLTVTAKGRSGERVTSTPSGISVAVGSTGSGTFTSGTSVTLAVSNGRDAVWSGACSSGGAKAKTCRMTLTSNASVTANVQ